MKKLFGILLVGMLLVAPANAQENVSFGISLDGYSGYIWRGGVVGADDKIALQPGVELGFGESGLTVGAWGSWFMQNRGGNLEDVDEIDLYADFSRTLSEDSGVGISIGFIEYVFPNGADGEKRTEEAYVGISLDNAIAPALTFYYDFNLFKTWYLALSAGVDVPLGSEDGPALSLGANIAMSNVEDSATESKKTGFHDITVTAAVGFDVGSVSISPTIGFAYADARVNEDNSAFWGGISIGFSP